MNVAKKKGRKRKRGVKKKTVKVSYPSGYDRRAPKYKNKTQHVKPHKRTKPRKKRKK